MNLRKSTVEEDPFKNSFSSKDRSNSRINVEEAKPRTAPANALNLRIHAVRSQLQNLRYQVQREKMLLEAERKNMPCGNFNKDKDGPPSDYPSPSNQPPPKVDVVQEHPALSAPSRRHLEDIEKQCDLELNKLQSYLRNVGELKTHWKRLMIKNQLGQFQSTDEVNQGLGEFREPHVGRYDLWFLVLGNKIQPKIDIGRTVNESADGNFEVTLATKATIYHQGLVEWKPPAIYKSSCEIDVEYFPFDEQTCVLKFGSWTYDGFKVDLRHMDEKAGSNVVDVGVDLSEFYMSVEWDILEVPAVRNEKFYTCCDEPYLDITFNITMRRKTLFYTVNIIIPCMGISFLTVLTFYLPSDSGEKVTLSISILISLHVFFLLVVEIIPPTSLVVPLLGKYLIFAMILVSIR
ncbi:acetylcholine receptor subunit alpha-like [Anoplophora glabripennis]|uniref:acetylcholine receptor subunit alpha-like n=1 Tax=Anoplophora glabripennis TaxID=217634 RepID=UPI000874E6BD|nr:acetylcholine receptor subunit alpha-like [Anoplophora glabripennis]